MTTTDTTFEVFCPGMLEVLSIGKGDLKLTLDGGSPEDVEKARTLVEEMLRKGYSIFVETDEGPVRVQRFNPRRMTYIISEVAADDGATEQEEVAGADEPGIFCPACQRSLNPAKYDASDGTMPQHRVGAHGPVPLCPQSGQPIGAEAVEDARYTPKHKRGRREREVPVAGSRATAVGKTAGGAGDGAPSADYYDGWDALRWYAVMRDGTSYVGAGLRTLKEALADVDEAEQEGKRYGMGAV